MSRSVPIPAFDSVSKVSSSQSRIKALKSVSDLKTLYSTEPVKEVILGINNNGKAMPASCRHYTIYTASSLAELARLTCEKYLDAVRNATEAEETLSDEESEELRTIRFLLTEKYELLFAEEGSEPAHFVMTGETQKPRDSRCRCAGNLVFNEDFSSFTLVSNKSGDFQPTAVLLKNVLGILVELHNAGLIQLNDTLYIQQYVGTSLTTRYSVSLDVLKEFVQNIFDKEQLQTFLTINQAAEKRQVIYEPPIQAFQPERKTIRRRRALFTEASEPDLTTGQAFSSSASMSLSYGLFASSEKSDAHDRKIDDALFNLLNQESSPVSEIPPSQKKEKAKRSLFDDSSELDAHELKRQKPNSLGSETSEVETQENSPVFLHK